MCWLDQQVIFTSISTLSSSLPISLHLKSVRQYWVNVGWSKKKIVIMVTQRYLLNLDESWININLNHKAADPTSKIGISEITDIFKNAMLSNLSTNFVSISKQSKDKRTPEDPPTCLTPANAWDRYVGKLKLNDSAIDKICK